MSNGEMIRRLRKKWGLSQKELGKKLNKSQQAVAKWEKGDAEPDVATLVKMSRIFDVTIDHILENNKLSKVIPQEYEKEIIEKFSYLLYGHIKLIASTAVQISSIRESIDGVDNFSDSTFTTAVYLAEKNILIASECLIVAWDGLCGYIAE